MRRNVQSKHTPVLLAFMLACLIGLMSSTAFAGADQHRAMHPVRHADTVLQQDASSRDTGGFMEWLLENNEFLKWLQTGGFMEWLTGGDDTDGE